MTNRLEKDSPFSHRLGLDQKSYTKPIDIVNKLNIQYLTFESKYQLKKGNLLGFTDNLRNISIRFFLV